MRKAIILVALLVAAGFYPTPRLLAQVDACDEDLGGVWASENAGIAGSFITYMLLYPDCSIIISTFEGGYEGTVITISSTQLRFEGELLSEAEPQPATFIFTYVGTHDQLIANLNRGDMAAPFERLQSITPADMAVCPDTPPSRMVVGYWGIVATSNGTSINLRQEPTTNAARTPLPAESLFTVIGGPECADDHTWWQITLIGQSASGWLAEGDAEGYFIKPIARQDPEFSPTPGAPEAGPLLASDEFLPVTLGADSPAASFRFNAITGQQAAVRYTWHDGDINGEITVYAPSGQELALAGMGAVRNGMINSYDLPETGTYTVLVTYTDEGETFAGYTDLSLSVSIYTP